MVLGTVCLVFGLFLLKQSRKEDFDEYLQKIWIREDWEGGNYEKVSFVIQKIGNREIEGIFSVRNNPDFDRREGMFSGHRNGNMAECFFVDADGNTGNLKIVLMGDERIEAEVEYANDTVYFKKEQMSDVSIYRPYRIADIEVEGTEFRINEQLQFPVELDNWGEILVTPGLFDTGDRTYPIVFFTDNAQNVLYKLLFFSQVGTEIQDIAVKDMNNDGRKDIEITTYFTGDQKGENYPIIIRDYFQWKDGLFYEEEDFEILEQSSRG
ncbi:hypothetical protein [Candidatus Merdisoma sp. JLR.KK006]|uniref:hypothetical protein n=1 Tax=Candidatus Merdisoma sp. JLR.KK006 TaxID=3112626 RepID=UPI002FF10084